MSSLPTLTTGLLTIIITSSVALHNLLSVIVTEYVLVAVGLTFIEAEVEYTGDQLYNIGDVAPDILVKMLILSP